MNATTTITMPNFTPPTMEQVREQAEKMSLSEIEARKFWCFYESKDWFVGRNKMKRWICALAGWQLRSQERTESKPAQNGGLSGAQIMLYQKEYDRILERIKATHNSYDSHQSMKPEHRIELGKLSTRKRELKTLLGISI